MAWYDEYLKDNPTEFNNTVICWRNKKNRLHREDGPAAIYKSGRQTWIKNGLLHREDGPAVIWEIDQYSWWIKGNEITEEVNKWIEENNYPHYNKWDDDIKIHFKIMFG